MYAGIDLGAFLASAALYHIVNHLKIYTVNVRQNWIQGNFYLHVKSWEPKDCNN